MEVKGGVRKFAEAAWEAEVETHEEEVTELCKLYQIGDKGAAEAAEVRGARAGRARARPRTSLAAWAGAQTLSLSFVRKHTLRRALQSRGGFTASEIDKLLLRK